MTQGFPTVKLSFFRWLEKHHKTDIDKLNQDDISIFEYAEEFREYVKSEYATNPISMNMGDILSLEFANGEFVIPDATAEEVVPEEVSGDEVVPAEADEEAAETPETPEVLSAQSEEQTEEAAEEEENNQNDIAELLNNLFAEDTFKTIIDTDQDGALSQEEISKYLEEISGIDGNKDDVSLEDILGAMENATAKAEEILASRESDTETPEEQTPESKVPEVKPTDTQARVDTQQRSSSSSSSGGSHFPSSGGDDKPKEKTLDTMNESELKSELTNANSKLTENQTKLSQALDGSSSTLAALKENINTAYDTYHEKLEEADKGMAEQVDKLKQAIDKKQSEVDENNKQIAQQELTVSESETAYNNAVSTRETLEGSLQELKATDTSDMSDEKKAEITQKINDLEQNKIPAAKKEEENAKKAWDDAKADLDKLNKNKDELENGEGGLTKLNEQMKALEEKIVEAHPEMADALKEYNDAKTTYETTQAKEISEAQKGVEESQAYVNKVQTALNNYSNHELERDYSVEAYDAKEGQRLVEVAKQMLAKYGSSTGYCATGVSRTIKMAYGISMNGNGCDWDTNMEKLAAQGMFAEVTSDYPSSNDLRNLPAGAVVCWENTANSGGGGRQYGHVTIADGQGGEISDHYQKNIYKSVGGRSDQYRVFIPV
ncbi:hypothetical protein IKQ26_07700 [bacterium]|nr:hypothetical protein [bacterium]